MVNSATPIFVMLSSLAPCSTDSDVTVIDSEFDEGGLSAAPSAAVPYAATLSDQFKDNHNRIDGKLFTNEDNDNIFSDEDRSSLFFDDGHCDNLVAAKAIATNNMLWDEDEEMACGST
ncbi:hypothetical protein HDU87_001929 [Geranomyces variabilis]|uniref:Uncharacterized protein n=1 Tax=Geranomyces variabilis TaxID=109894 RepID=A0AAD5TNF2_9FUNG|nr:hypothetical protein HDU87_001929 [Geranomyces variabilis]